jgi:predicted alpha/beta superfamily hydrolase
MSAADPTRRPGPPGAETVTTLMAETFALASQARDLDYRIWVARPLQPPPPEGHAVLFMFDARAYFAGVVEITRLMSISQEIPPLIVVGMGYDAPSYPEQVARRMFDLSLTDRSVLSSPEAGGFLTGGAPDLLVFIENELKPFIARHYPANLDQSLLLGHSLGGLTALYEALRRPEQYSGFIASSPAIGLDRDAIEQAIEASARSRAAARLYVSAGDLERAVSGHIADDVERLADRLSAPAFAHLDRLVRVLPHETHATAIYVALSQGLRWMLRESPADLAFDIAAFAPPASA